MRIERHPRRKLESEHAKWHNVAVGLVASLLLLPGCASDSDPTVASDITAVAGPTLSSATEASPSSSGGSVVTTSPSDSSESDGSVLEDVASSSTDAESVPEKATTTSTATASVTAPIRILAVGDSITDTYGVDDTMDQRLGYSYRCKLWGKLVAEYPGVDFQFVGPVSDFPPGQTYGGVEKLVCEAKVGLAVPAENATAFSNQRAAWGGHMIHEILEHLTKPQLGFSDAHDTNYLFDESSGVTFPDLSFDVALVHAGTNNIFGSRGQYWWDGSLKDPWKWDDSWEEKTYFDVKELVDTLQYISSEGQILLAEIVPCNNDTVTKAPDGSGYIYARPGELGTDAGGCVHVDNRDHAKGTYDVGGVSGAPGSIDSDHEGQGTIDISIHQIVGFVAREEELDVVPIGEGFNVGIHVRDEWNGDSVDGYDGVHPNNAGAEHMAAAWFTALEPVIDGILADRAQ